MELQGLDLSSHLIDVSGLNLDELDGQAGASAVVMQLLRLEGRPGRAQDAACGFDSVMPPTSMQA